MAFWEKWLVPWYSGLAFSKFQRQKYKDAARLFEKICKLDPKGDRMELIYSCLGRCYLALEKNNEAFKVLTTAYDLYRQRGYIPKEDFNRVQYKEFLRAYSYILSKVGQESRSKEVALELEKLSEKMG